MIIDINPNKFDEKELFPAVNALKNGGICAFPTETVYGLGANAYSTEAVKKIFKAKGRPQDNPLIVHISDTSELSDVCSTIPPKAKKLMDRFWGGPLTLIMPKSDKIPDTVSAGLNTVGIRLPSHPIANSLIKLCGFPIAAPSANLSGKPSPTVPKHVIDDLSGRADVIINGGNCFYGVESTVIDMTVEPPEILRPGGVTKEEISSCIGEVIFGFGTSAPKSPGMKYKHYAPKAPVFVVESNDPVNTINNLIAKNNSKCGVLSFKTDTSLFNSELVFSAGNTEKEYAARLFYFLREFDNHGADVIYAIPPEKGGIGDAVLNRLYKSAGGKIITD